jgi:hypothetical protein
MSIVIDKKENEKYSKIFDEYKPPDVSGLEIKDPGIKTHLEKFGDFVIFVKGLKISETFGKVMIVRTDGCYSQTDDDSEAIEQLRNFRKTHPGSMIVNLSDILHGGLRMRYSCGVSDLGFVVVSKARVSNVIYDVLFTVDTGARLTNIPGIISSDVISLVNLVLSDGQMIQNVPVYNSVIHVEGLQIVETQVTSLNQSLLGLNYLTHKLMILRGNKLDILDV